jgi:hypothetical protein
MAWTVSAVFQEFVKNPATRAFNAATAPTNYVDILTDVIKVSLFDNTITPDKDAVVGSTGYNTGVWASGGVSHANWPATGQTLATDTYTDVANAMMYDAADLAGAGTLTLTNAYGCFVYDDAITAGTVADQGICFNYFGGAQTVTGGTFTIVWHANGLLRFTV